MNRRQPPDLATTYQAILDAHGTAPGPLPAARGRTEAPGRMNKTEAAWAEELRLQRLADELAHFWFQSFKLRLADKAWYTPDFVVMRPDGYLEVHEVKGFMRDDAAVKIKVAAETYPFLPFFIVRRRKGRWEVEAV